MRESEIEKRLKNAVKMRGRTGFEVCIAEFQRRSGQAVIVAGGKGSVCGTESNGTENEKSANKAKKAIRSIRVFGVLH